MKITQVAINSHRKSFEIRTSQGSWSFPFAKADPAPDSGRSIHKLIIDPELGFEGFTYTLTNGEEGSVLIDHILDYNRDPGYLADLLLFKLTVAALLRIEAGGVSKRELMRRLGTSPAQFYRLLDTTNYRKSIRQMMALLHLLGCDVDLVVQDRIGA